MHMHSKSKPMGGVGACCAKLYDAKQSQTMVVDIRGKSEGYHEHTHTGTNSNKQVWSSSPPYHSKHRGVNYAGLSYRQVQHIRIINMPCMKML